MANNRTPKADDVLDSLLMLPDGALREVLQAAREYSDHPSIKGVTGVHAGTRLMMQIELGLNEFWDKVRRETHGGRQ